MYLTLLNDVLNYINLILAFSKLKGKSSHTIYTTNVNEVTIFYNK